MTVEVTSIIKGSNLIETKIISEGGTSYNKVGRVYDIHRYNIHSFNKLPYFQEPILNIV